MYYMSQYVSKNIFARERATCHDSSADHCMSANNLSTAVIVHSRCHGHNRPDSERVSVVETERNSTMTRIRPPPLRVHGWPRYRGHRATGVVPQ